MGDLGDKEDLEDLEDYLCINISPSLRSLPQLPLPATMVKLILLIGLPGSGKSSLAQKLLSVEPKLKLISSDRIRKQLFGDEAIQGAWFLIWQQVQREFGQAHGEISQKIVQAAIYDATNAQRRNRREAIAIARATGFTHITGLWVDTPVWLCLSRNRQRSRIVPEEVIFRMHRQLRDAPPSLNEGLDELIRLSAIAQSRDNAIAIALRTELDRL